MPQEALRIAGTQAGDTNEDLLRERIRELLHSSELSQAQIARQAGVGHAAFNQWLQGRYVGDNAAIAGKLEQWLAARARAAAMTQLPAGAAFVETPTARRILAALSHAQWMADLVEISGPPGIGKTRTATHYRDSSPSVFYAMMSPGCASGVAAFEQICEDIGIANPPQGVRRMARAIRERIEGTRGVLIIDECQHLAIPAIDELRAGIYDRAGVGMVLMGSETLPVRMLGRGGNTAQIVSRMGRRLLLRRPAAGDGAELVKSWGIKDADARKFLASIAGARGGLRAIVKTMRLAALSRGGDVSGLEEEDVQGAWAVLSNERGEES
jgi:DNA transposition AAA+ family ATPase